MQEWIKGIDYPEWAGQDYLTTISKGYLQGEESPEKGYRRIAKQAASYLVETNIPDLEEQFFNMFWKGWLIPSTPVMANMGVEYALPIACYNSVTDDSISSMWEKNAEIAMMSKMGGGTSLYANAIRPIGSPIKGGKAGYSEGIMPFMKPYDATIYATKQSKVRRGACAIYVDITHPQSMDFIRIGDEDSGELFCKNLQTGLCITDEFMNSLKDNKTNRETYMKAIRMRIKRGFPFFTYIDTANRNKPFEWNTDITIKSSNLCNEIYIPSDSKHSFVCCLSSLNLFKYDEWKDTNTIFLATLFLDAVMEEFIVKAKEVPELECALRFAIKSRALGLGVMGLHSYMQVKMISYESLAARSLCRVIFGKIKADTISASMYLGNIYGSPEWAEGSGRRNITLTAIPPTRSSSILAGNMSEGQQPFVSNYYVNQTAKISITQINFIFVDYLKSIGKYSEEILEDVSKHKGSCQHLDFLSDDAKEVFKTRFEINQMALVELTGVIQSYIEQGISCNLSFPTNAPPKFIKDVHVKAWEVGLKGLYYLKSESVVEIDNINKTIFNDCVVCEG